MRGACQGDVPPVFTYYRKKHFFVAATALKVQIMTWQTRVIIFESFAENADSSIDATAFAPASMPVYSALDNLHQLPYAESEYRDRCDAADDFQNGFHVVTSHACPNCV